jgi:hypothetical protein
MSKFCSAQTHISTVELTTKSGKHRLNATSVDISYAVHMQVGGHTRVEVKMEGFGQTDILILHDALQSGGRDLLLSIKMREQEAGRRIITALNGKVVLVNMQSTLTHQTEEWSAEFVFEQDAHTLTSNASKKEPVEKEKITFT